MRLEIELPPDIENKLRSLVLDWSPEVSKSQLEVEAGIQAAIGINASFEKLQRQRAKELAS